MCIAENLQSIRTSLPGGTRLVAVSKFHPIEAISEAYEAGHRLFGESRVQELLMKHSALPTDIQWHFIGHLQKNKVKQIVSFVDLIHSVDRVELLEEINRQGEKIGRIVPCLIQIHIAQEETKYGFSIEECRAFFSDSIYNRFPYVRIEGLMGMATFTDDEKQINDEFGRLAALFREISNNYSGKLPYFNELSMGMSDDYSLAVALGSTLVRVGSKIFGSRQ